MRTEVIGGCTLYLGDCYDMEIFADSLITDPPYGLGQKTGTIGVSRKKNAYDEHDDTMFNVRSKIIPAIAKFLGTTKRAAITPGPKAMMFYPEPKDVGIFFQPAACGMSFWGRTTWQPILFYGDDPRLGKTIDHLHRQVTEKASTDEHPCAKPQAAWDWLVNKASLEGDTVLDPFMGSGTGGVSCVKLGRKFIGVEKSMKYFDLSCRRIEAAVREPMMFPAKLKTEKMI
ncbi:MAG: DNA methyltransferase [Sulfuricellaceae bacterium]